MADKKISALTGATTPLAGTEVLPIVQNGATVKVAVSDLTAGRTVSASAATISGDLTVDTNTLKVDSTNNRVGVLQASPQYPLDIWTTATGTAAGDNTVLSGSSAAAGRDSHLRLNDNSSGAVRYGQISGKAYIWTNGGSRLWIDTGGNVLINRTTQFTSEKFHVTQDADAKNLQVRSTSAALTNTIIQCNAVRNTTNGTFFTFAYYNDTDAYYKFYVRDAGDIYSTSTSITGISDQRFKENIRDLDHGLKELMALRPRRFDWKEGQGNGKKNVAGFVAQETQPIIPDVIDVWKRTPDDVAEYLGIRMTDLIPMMVKSIQELKKEVNDLKSKLAT